MQLCYQNYALNTGEKFNLTFRKLQTFTLNYFACRSKRRENLYNFPTCEKNRITLLISQTIFLTYEKNPMTNGIAFHQRETIFIRYVSLHLVNPSTSLIH